MTEEERREMMRSNYAAQMEMLGYDASGNPLDMVHVVRCRDCKYGKLCFDADGHGLIQCTNTNYPAANIEAWPLELDWYCAGGERRESE